MEKYTLKALKITSVIILSFFGFIGLIGLVKASPPSGYDYGRKIGIHHDAGFGTWMWVLKCNLAVDYLPGGSNYISRWTITGSCAHVYHDPWTTHGYTSEVTQSPPVGGVYSWVKHMNSAEFETIPYVHHGLASAWNYITVNQGNDGDAVWHQYTPHFLWIVDYNDKW